MGSLFDPGLNQILLGRSQLLASGRRGHDLFWLCGDDPSPRVRCDQERGDDGWMAVCDSDHSFPVIEPQFPLRDAGSKP